MPFEVLRGQFTDSPKDPVPLAFAAGRSSHAHRRAFQGSRAQFLLRPPDRGAPSLDFLPWPLEAFDLNLLGPVLGLDPVNETLNRLFAFGIDPVGGGLPTDVPSDWPPIAEGE